MGKDTTLKVRLGVEELAGWRASAKGEGVSLSAWIRARCAVGAPVKGKRVEEPVRASDPAPFALPEWLRGVSKKSLQDFQVSYGRPPGNAGEIEHFAKYGW